MENLAGYALEVNIGGGYALEANIGGVSMLPGADGKSAYDYAVEGGYTGTEAEFAEKMATEMPDALPNPNPLTFTGAVTGSYDGSEALNVEIPSSGGEIPKPLTYDYMPEGYPTKTMGTVTLMDEQAVAFTSMDGLYLAEIENAPEIVEGQTYTVNWDGTEYECVCGAIESNHVLGNLSIMGAGEDTGEPFVYAYDISHSFGQWATLGTSASHIISIKRIEEVSTPMAYDFMPEGYPTKRGQNTTLMVEQELSFDIVGSIDLYKAQPNEALEIVEGQPYMVNWDGTEYKVLAMRDREHILLGNLAIMDDGDDTGEPFLYSFDTDIHSSVFYTLDTSSTHTISVTELATITPMAEEFIPKMNVSAFTNDSGYLTLATLPKYGGEIV